MHSTLTRTFPLRAAIVIGLFFVCVSISAQTPATQVIPAPKSIEAGSGSFSIDKRVHLVLADGKSADDRFAAQDFIDDLKATADLSLTIAKGSRHTIIIGRIDLPLVVETIKRQSFTIPSTLTDEGYVILANADQVIVAGDRKSVV